jgi:hypothetical protein
MIPAVWFDDSSFLSNEYCGFFGEFCGFLGGSCGPSVIRGNKFCGTDVESDKPNTELCGFN